MLCSAVLHPTGVAEVRFVLDCGLRRQLVYDPARHLSALKTTWCSQAACKQRAGRTGRVFPGTTLRLFPETFHAALDAYDDPETRTAPLEKLYLSMKQFAGKLPLTTAPYGQFGNSVDGEVRRRPAAELLSLTPTPPDVTESACAQSYSSS